MATKLDLLATIKELHQSVSDLSQTLAETERELRMAKNDAARHASNATDIERRLQAVCTVVIAAMVVKHESTPYADDKATEELRFLRHIHSLTNINPPF